MPVDVGLIVGVRRSCRQTRHQGGSNEASGYCTDMAAGEQHRFLLSE